MSATPADGDAVHAPALGMPAVRNDTLALTDWAAFSRLVNCSVKAYSWPAASEFSASTRLRDDGALSSAGEPAVILTLPLVHVHCSVNGGRDPDNDEGAIVDCSATRSEAVMTVNASPPWVGTDTAIESRGAGTKRRVSDTGALSEERAPDDTRTWNRNCRIET